MDKMKMQTSDLADENFQKLAKLFPNAVTETKDENGNVVRSIDADVLRQEINTSVVEGPDERYQFTWPGKREAIRLAASPVAASLRPCREESVDFDKTENVYIEGDNLDVLKLLRETYLGRVKMIYIDPPYNTGNDFIYNDDFAMDAEEFRLQDNQYDDQGNRLIQNTESNGRFHTDWLNMIYPRLRIAKDMLSEDGVIFISIDDNEQENLKKICNEIFGEYNFIAQCSVQKSTNGMGDKKGFARNHEFILCYQKSDNAVFYGLSPSQDYLNLFNKKDEHGKYKIDGILMKKGAGSRREDSPSLHFPLYYSPKTGEVSICAKDGFKEIYPYKSDGTAGRWTWGKEKVSKESYRLYAGENGTIYVKDYLTDTRRMKIKTILEHVDYLTDRATNEIKNLFNKKVFDTPKPIKLILDLCDLVTRDNDIIFDFFSGSSTTAHAVMQLNIEDGGKRKFIMVQVPEICDADSEAFKAGYKNICEIGEERIRRAGKKIKEESPMTTANLDTGFRVFKLDSSNMKDVYYNPGKTEQKDLLGHVDNIKEDRTPEDLLFQVMLEFGIPLSSKIRKTAIAGKDVFNVEDNFLIACFDDDITNEIITAIAKEKPQYVVLRDSGFKTDSVAANFEQIFATYSPDTTRRVL